MTSLTIHMGAPPAGDDPQWAVDLRAAFTGITYANTYTVPDGIAHDGTGDVRDALQAFIDGVADGPSPTSHNRIIFPTGYSYRLVGGAGPNAPQALEIDQRANLTIDGTGCTLDLSDLGDNNYLWGDTFYIHRSNYISIRGFSVLHGNTGTGTSSTQMNEHYGSIAAGDDCSYIEWDSLHFDDQLGFGPWGYCSPGGSHWPENIWLHDSFIRGAVMGIAVTAVRKFLIEDCEINDSSLIAIDLESDSAQLNGGGFEDVLVQDCTFDYYGWSTAQTNWWLATVPSNPLTATYHRLTVRRNHVLHGNARSGSYGGLATRADATSYSGERPCVQKTDYVIDANWTEDTQTSGSTFNVEACAGLTITNNTQPISSGDLVWQSLCTDVTISGNVTT
jgi:hypothetical protein